MTRGSEVTQGVGRSHSDEVLTKNPDVEVLQDFEYLWVDFGTFREVNNNGADFTAVLLLCTRVWGWEGVGMGGWVIRACRDTTI